MTKPVAQEWIAGMTIAGKFRVLGLRGRGGMGDVLEVEHVYTKRVGALKILNPQCAAQPAIVERFIREASAAGRIGSPHIVEMLDAGISPEGLPYLFMELLSGLSIEDLLQQRGALPFAEALDLVLQAARGLDAAHQAGIVHRDVKPANLFVVNPGQQQRVKLVDFGISKFAASDGVSALTVVGTTMGTPLYMSYEQLLASNDVDARTDVYALGVVLYECLTARLPFTAESLVGLSIAIQRGNYVRVSELRADIPQEFDAVIERCLVASRELRFPSMSALISALESHPAVALGGSPAATPALRQRAATELQAPPPQDPVRTQLMETAAAVGEPSLPGARLAPGAPAVAAPAGSGLTSEPFISAAGGEPAVGSGARRNTLLALGAAAALAGAAGLFYWVFTGASGNGVTAVAPSASAAEPVGAAQSAVASVPGTVSTAVLSSTEDTRGAPPVSAPVALPGVDDTAPPLVPTVAVRPAAGAAPLASGSPAARVNSTPSSPPLTVPTAPGRDSAKQRARCARLLERLSIGETLSAVEQKTLSTECKK